MRSLVSPAFLVLVGSLAVACTSGGGTAGPEDCFIDESRFRDLEVSAGTEPQLAWCGAPARALAVTRSAGATVWGLECVNSEALCIIPSVTYGDTIPNTTITTPPQPLEAGQAYRYCLFGIEDRPPVACLDFSP